MTPKHTPVPWELKINKDGGRWVYRIQSAVEKTSQDVGKHICDTNPFLEASGDANATLIVKAVNSHQALVEALHLAQHLIECLTIDRGPFSTTQATLNAIEDALKQAEGG